MSANHLPSRTLQTNKIINNFPAFLYNLRGNSWCTLELHHICLNTITVWGVSIPID